MLARRDERNLEPLPKARALGMGFAGRGSVNPDHLKSRTRTLGRPYRRKGVHTSKRTSRPVAVYPEKSSTKEIYGISRGSKSVGHDLWRPRSSLHSSTPGSLGLRDQLSGGPQASEPGPQSACPRCVLLPPLSREPREESGPGEACRQPESNKSVPTRLAAAHTRVSIPRPTAAWGLRPVQARRTPVGLGELRP